MHSYVWHLVRAGLSRARQPDWTQGFVCAQPAPPLAIAKCTSDIYTFRALAASRPLGAGWGEDSGPQSIDHLLNLCLRLDFTRSHCTNPAKEEDPHQVPSSTRHLHKGLSHKPPAKGARTQDYSKSDPAVRVQMQQPSLQDCDALQFLCVLP